MMSFFDKIAGMLTWTLADSRDHKLVPGLATSRRANSRWNMRIATRNRGRCERSLKTRGLEIWYGVFDMQTSKYGRGSTLTKSPITTWSLRWAGLHWNKARSETGEIKRRNGIEERKKMERRWKWENWIWEYVRSLHPLHYFRGHTWIHLNRCNVFRLFENLDGEVSSTGADFQHFVCRFQICLNRAITMRSIQVIHFRETNHVNYPNTHE